MPIAIDSESTTQVETPIKTDEDGRVERLIRSSDTVTISSLYPAIAFTPVSGQAMELFLMGDVAINAQRLVENNGVCRRFNDQAQEEIVYRFFNITDSMLTIEHDENLNQLSYPDGTPLAVQAPQTFESGQGQFAVPITQFRNTAKGTNITGGTWKFLASDSSFSYGESIDQNPVPICDGSIVSPCAAVSDAALQAVIDRAGAEVTALFMYSAKLKKKLGGRIRRLPYLGSSALALRNIRGVVSQIRGKTYSCGISPYRCRQAQFPRATLENHFATIFASTPSTKRKEFRRYRSRAIKRFRTFMAGQFPSYSYICE